ncbi:MAG: DpnII family type II restriction endonuclease [Thermoproteota archaeon]|nr:DpnII family type II restriction endonuclease [Thermoproteota archaeon]
MNSKEVSRKLSYFYATLDLKSELPERTISEGLTPFLKKMFKEEENFWKYAEFLQKLKDTYKTENALIKKVADMLKSDPRYFLVLAHLHRQLRFTNLELVHFLFDRNKLNTLSYYVSLMKSDPVFKQLAIKRASLSSWSAYVGEINLESSEANVLASFKKVVTSYLGSESKRWKRWKSRIENDSTSSDRIAEFVVRNEDLKQLIESGSVVNALKRSLRTVSVEILKKERGEYGSRQIEDILCSAGFVFEPYEKIGDIEELEKTISSQKTLFETKSKYIYTKEKEWKREEKRFDFVLISNRKVQFVIETNYYTTAMSKVREVVKHFVELKKACREKYRLIYITDGMGWLKLAKSVKSMIEFEIEEQKTERSPVPFLMNLEIFRQDIRLIKSEMR